MTGGPNHIGGTDTSKVSAKAMTLLDRQIADAKNRATFATTDDLRRYYAEKAVGLQFDRGDFPMIQALDSDTRKSLVNALLKVLQQ